MGGTSEKKTPCITTIQTKTIKWEGEEPQKVFQQPWCNLLLVSFCYRVPVCLHQWVTLELVDQLTRSASVATRLVPSQLVTLQLVPWCLVEPVLVCLCACVMMLSSTCAASTSAFPPPSPPGSWPGIWKQGRHSRWCRVELWVKTNIPGSDNWQRNTC